MSNTTPTRSLIVHDLEWKNLQRFSALKDKLGMSRQQLIIWLLDHAEAWLRSDIEHEEIV